MALTGGSFEAFTVQNLYSSVRVADQACSLQRISYDRDRLSTNAEHAVRNFWLRWNSHRLARQSGPDLQPLFKVIEFRLELRDTLKLYPLILKDLLLLLQHAVEQVRPFVQHVNQVVVFFAPNV